MKIIKNTTRKNKLIKPIIKRLILALVCVLILIVFSAVLFSGYMKIKGYQDKVIEKKIDKKFNHEVSSMSNIQVKSFQLWEGDSIAEIEVKDKGLVRMWYGIDGIPRLMRVGNYSTTYDCFYVDGGGNKKNYAFSLSLNLTKKSPFKKWFQFEVNNLSDLVLRYEDIIKILGSFPKNPETIEYKDGWGTRQILKQSNSDYVVKPDINKSNVSCDLFTKSSY